MTAPVIDLQPSPLDAGATFGKVGVDLAADPLRPTGLSRSIRDVIVMTRRNLVHIAREPMQLSDVTIQPILFTLLFVYVFGSGIPIAGGSYKEFALAGLLTMNLTTSALGTSVGLATDLSTGAIERFRTLPMWRSAVLVGRTLSDVMSAALCATIVGLTGLAIGWRPQSNFLSVLAAFGVALLFSYALSWATACLGLISKGPESAMSAGFIVIFPLAFVSNALVPTQHMPSWLRLIADWNPVSAVTAAARHLFGNPNPTTSHAWPMLHPVVASILWSVAIIAVAAPTAAHLFRQRTTE
jgi:ABC-2 type transport system permease protein